MQAPEGSSPVDAMNGDVDRTPPGSESGACVQRGNSGTGESRLFPDPETGTGDRLLKSPGVGGPLPPAGEPQGTRNQGSRPGIGKRAKSEAPRDGQAAVLAKHSTDGRQEVSRSGTWGTEAHGTHGREGKAVHHASLRGTTGETSSSPTVSPNLSGLRQQSCLGSKVMHEEPDDLIGHVRICGGAGG